MATSSVTNELFRKVMGCFATGVTVVTVERQPGSVHGMTANSFTSVSLDPYLISICVDQNARLLTYLKVQRRFGINILKEGQRAVSEYFARPYEDPDFEAKHGMRFQWTETGIPLLEGVLAQLACNVVGEHLTGDHTIFIAEVESMNFAEGRPLLYFRGKYHNLEE
jgi:flavin reductase (DIM6/NTAB) family NADH-FMN oxidoreductase RutF